MRNTEDIIQQINEEAQKYPELLPLQQNNASVSVWNAMKAVFAFSVAHIERMFHTLKNEIQTNIDTTQTGTRQWYIEQVRKFQYGDLLRVIGNVLKYSTTNKEKQIIHMVSVRQTEKPAELLFKVLKKDNQVLTIDELSALQSYMDTIKIMGTKISLRSIPPDPIRLNIELDLDRQIFTAEGKTINQNKDLIKDTLKTFLATMAFDSIFYLSRLTDALQAIEGVMDIKVKTAHCKDNNDNWQPIERKYEPPSGHLTLDTQSSLTYVFD